MSDCVCFQDYIAELEVAQGEIKRLKTALSYFTKYDDEKPMSWAYKREEAFRRANIIIGSLDEIERLLAIEERLREALERVSTSNNLPFIWEVSRAALEEEKK